MELQLSTAKAQQQLKQIEQSLGSLQAAFSNFAKTGTGNLESSLQRLGTFKGPNPAAVEQIRALSKAIGQISRAGDISKVYNSLNQLQSVNIGKTAQAVQQLSAALAAIRVPPGLVATANAINRIGQAAGQAAMPVRSLGGALNSVHAPAGLQAVAQGLARVGQQANQSSNGVHNFRSAIMGAQGALAGFGVYLGAQGFSQFIGGVKDAVTSLDRFKRLVENRSGASAVGDELNYINEAATRLAVPLDTARTTYARLYDTVINSGKEAGEARKLFEGFAKTFAALGLTGEQTARGFKAVEQMMSKGAINAEELRQQLGELFPAFTMLAKSMGKTPMELSKMMEAGKVASSELFKFADGLSEKFGGAALKAVEQLQGSLTNLATGWQFMQERFGNGADGNSGFFGALLPGIKALSEAINSPEFLAGAERIGTALGMIANAGAQAFSWIITNVPFATEIMFGLGVAFAALPLVWVLGAMGGIVASFMTFAAAALPIVGIVAAVGAGLYLLYQGFLKIGEVIGSVSKWLSETFSAGLAALEEDFNSLVVAVTDVWNWFTQLPASLVGFIQSLFGVGEASSASAVNLTATANAAGLTAANSANAASSTQSLSNAMGGVATNTDAAATSTLKAADSMGRLSGTTATFSAAASQAASSSGQMAVETGKAAGASGDLNSKSGAASGSVSSLASSLNNSAAAAQRAAAAYRAAAAAAAALKAAQGGGGGSSSVDSYAGGGISGQGNGRKVNADMSVFATAPHFATGGTTNGLSPSLPGGGIPAVLHANEAVVPLTGGGAIPIEGGGGGTGQSTNTMAKLFRDLLFSLRDINLDVIRVWESIDQQTNIMSDAFEVTNRNLVQIHQTLTLMNGRMLEMINAIGKVGSGGGGGGGSGSFTGGGGSVADASAQLRNQVSKMNADKKTEFNTKTKGKVASPGAIATYWDGGYYDYEANPMHQWDKEWDNKFTQVYRDFVAQYGAQALFSAIPSMGKNPQSKKYWTEYEKYIKTGKKMDLGGGVIGFATGSPNASKDLMSGGGFNAVLHPDEAVIPLPDGRSVPMQLPDQLLSNIEYITDQLNGLNSRASSREGSNAESSAFINRARRDIGDGVRRATAARRSETGGTPTILVQMTINTPDARSFRASEPQILQEMQAKLARASKTLGQAQILDDPTRT